jgi:hypothetical protein
MEKLLVLFCNVALGDPPSSSCQSRRSPPMAADGRLAVDIVLPGECATSAAVVNRAPQARAGWSRTFASSFSRRWARGSGPTSTRQPSPPLTRRRRSCALLVDSANASRCARRDRV